MATMKNEVHITLTQNGHVMSTDCWCEPTSFWSENEHGIKFLVVEHEDFTLAHRRDVLMAREHRRSLPSPDFRENDTWITRALTPPWDTPMLPPHQEGPL